MKIIVDTNILYSSLLKYESPIRQHLLDSNDKFYTPSFAIVEIFKHKERILENSRLTEENLLELLHKIFNRVKIINEDIISNDSWKIAYNLCKDVDLNDIPFVAAAIELDGKLWSGDKKLRQKLTDLGFTSFYFI